MVHDLQRGRGEEVDCKRVAERHREIAQNLSVRDVFTLADRSKVLTKLEILNFIRGVGKF